MGRNIGVLQTTVAEIVTVKEHQRGCNIILKTDLKLTVCSSRILHYAFCLEFRVGYDVIQSVDRR